MTHPTISLATCPTDEGWYAWIAVGDDRSCYPLGQVPEVFALAVVLERALSRAGLAHVAQRIALPSEAM